MTDQTIEFNCVAMKLNRLTENLRALARLVLEDGKDIKDRSTDVPRCAWCWSCLRAFNLGAIDDVPLHDKQTRDSRSKQRVCVHFRGGISKGVGGRNKKKYPRTFPDKEMESQEDQVVGHREPLRQRLEQNMKDIR